MRVSALIVAVLLLASAASAEPRHHWYKDWKNWALVGAAVGSSLFATHEAAACRARNDLIHCPDGGYGPFNGREYGARLGTSLFVAGLSVYGREHWRGRWYDGLLNDSPVIAMSGWNLAVGVSDHRVPTYPKLDASKFRVTR